MEYCSARCDPYEKGYTETLEKVQRRAARFVKGDYRQQSMQPHPNDRLAESKTATSCKQIDTDVQNHAWSL